MRIKGRATAKWNPDQDLTAGKSFVYKIPNWDEVVAAMNLSGEYEKGTPIVSRSVSYHAKIGSIAEQIQLCGKSRFRTITEVLRVAIQLGIHILYHIYCVKGAKSDTSYAAVFFKQLEISENRSKVAKIALEIVNQMKECEKCVLEGTMTLESARSNLLELYESVPEDGKKYISLMANEHIGARSVLRLAGRIF
jgi:hypothetical protein